MNTLVNKGKSVEIVTPSGGYASGQPVLQGSLVGISGNKYAQGDIAVIWLVGSHTVAKAAETWSVGDKLYWDDTNKVFTKVASTGTGETLVNYTFAGYAAEATTSGAGTGVILLRQ